MRGLPATRAAHHAYRPLQRYLTAPPPRRWQRLLAHPRLARHLLLLVTACGLAPAGLRHPAAVVGATVPPAVAWLYATDAAPVAIRHHRVAAGESLAAIAAHYGLTPETVRWANGIGDLDPLIVGQELRIPPVDGVLHYVAAGETVRTIAQAYGAAPEAVARYNGVDDPDRPLRAAQIMVPGGRPLGPVMAALGAVGSEYDAVAAREGARQLPFAGVTLWVVDDPERAKAAAAAAEQPAKTWAEIEAEAAQATAAAEAASRAGVPTPVEYEVQPGDTINGLAERFGITPLTIIAANDLSSDTLQVGQRLLILPVSGVLYTVQEDDTLYDIALRFRVDLGPIIDYNGLESADTLQVGQRLVIPGAEPQRPAPPAPARALAPTVRVPNAVPRARGAPDGVALDSIPSTGSGKGEALVALAMRYLGYPYVFGGTTPSGFDCSGFVYYVHRQQGIPLSRGMMGQYTAGPHIPRDALQPGDIVFFSNTYMPGLSHNGIYIGNGKFIHASHPGVGVVVSSLSEPYWASRYSGATRAH
jgi:peptidoglycan endopeptidase LytE